MYVFFLKEVGPSPACPSASLVIRLYRGPTNTVYSQQGFVTYSGLLCRPAMLVLDEIKKSIARAPLRQPAFTSFRHHEVTLARVNCRVHTGTLDPVII